MVRHVLPNVTGPVLVIATLNLGLAIISEATLSFLGVGLPSTQPLARHADPPRQRGAAVGRLVDHGASRRDLGGAGAGGEPARRPAARRPEPEAAMMDHFGFSLAAAAQNTSP